MEQPIEKKFQNLSLSSSYFGPAMEEPIEKQFERILSLPCSSFCPKPTEKQIQITRISISSRFLYCLDQVVAAIVRNAEGMHLMVWGPHMLPTQVMNVTTRLAPSPKGYNLVRNSELRYHGRVVDVLGSTELVEQIISGVGANHVFIEVKVVDLGGARYSEQGQVGASLG